MSPINAYVFGILTAALPVACCWAWCRYRIVCETTKQMRQRGRALVAEGTKLCRNASELELQGCTWEQAMSDWNRAE